MGERERGEERHGQRERDYNPFIDQVLLSSVGCSNDERYNEEWKAENYIMVTLLSVIGTFMIE